MCVQGNRGKKLILKLSKKLCNQERLSSGVGKSGSFEIKIILRGRKLCVCAELTVVADPLCIPMSTAFLSVSGDHSCRWVWRGVFTSKLPPSWAVLSAVPRWRCCQPLLASYAKLPTTTLASLFLLSIVALLMESTRQFQYFKTSQIAQLLGSYQLTYFSQLPVVGTSISSCPRSYMVVHAFHSKTWLKGSPPSLYPFSSSGPRSPTFPFTQQLASAIFIDIIKK